MNRRAVRRLSAPGAALLLLLMLGACVTVGPEYAPPKAGVPETWHQKPESGLGADSLNSQEMAQWWHVLDDPVLTDLIQRALTGNLDLKQAISRVREARARRGLTRAAEFPGLDAAASAAKSKTGTLESELYSADLDASWEVDVFGGRRRATQAADADIGAAMADAAAVRVSLVAETALNYLDVRIYQARIETALAGAANQADTCDLARSRYQAGLSDDLAVQQALHSLESTRAKIPALRTNLAAALNRLAVLTGQVPGKVHALLADIKAVPLPPAEVVVGVPAEALRRRPDIRQAERQVAAQTARIGVAVADLYPKFTLSGAIGVQSAVFSELTSTAGRFWRIGPGVSWNIFDAGAVRRNIEVQSALQEQALITYENTVLAALEETENAMTAYIQEQIRHQHLEAALDAADQALQLALDKYTAGLVDFTHVLDSQQAVISFQDQIVQSRGAIVTDLIHIYKALGGGWTPEAASPDTTDNPMDK